MKCTIPEISWHNRDPVLSLDIQTGSQSDEYKLVTGGTDNHVVIWQLKILDNGGIAVEMLSDLTGHNRAVNAVRFSPDGQYLASSDDEAALIIWKKNENSTGDIFLENKDVENKENWTVVKMLRGHIEDISDVSWSKCSQFLVSGSVDNSAIMWDIQKGKSIGILKDHKGFVQGVSWDPLGQYVVTICSDRMLRFHSATSQKVVQKVLKCNLPSASTENDQQPKQFHLFHDDTLKSFCRRLSFSPDGELLAVPSGILETEEGNQINCTHIFSRLCLSKPVMCFPTKKKSTIAISWCPVLFELRSKKQTDDKNEYANLFHLPYRMVFAVAAQNAIFIHDTQQPIPFARISDIHYTRLSDISWSSDGKILAASSTDGYCSLVYFKEGELGVEYRPSDDKVLDEEPMDLDETLSSGPALSSTESPISDEEMKPIENIPIISAAETKATPILVKKAPSSNKPVKRVPLITLSSKPLEVTPSEPSTSKSLPVPNLPKDDAASSDPSSSKPGPRSSEQIETSVKPNPITPKAPRRVSLITLSSPKTIPKSKMSDLPP